MLKKMIAVALALPLLGSAAIAEDTVKIGYIDPLSGGGASVGEVGLKTFQFLAEEFNAKGGVLGKKVEIVPLRQQDQSAGKPDPGAEGDRRRRALSSPRATARRSPARCPTSSPSTTSATPARKCCTSTTPRSIRS